MTVFLVKKKLPRDRVAPLAIRSFLETIGARQRANGLSTVAESWTCADYSCPEGGWLVAGILEEARKAHWSGLTAYFARKAHISAVEMCFQIKKWHTGQKLCVPGRNRGQKWVSPFRQHGKHINAHTFLSPKHLLSPSKNGLRYQKTT